MKKFLAITLSCLTALSLFACAGNNAPYTSSRHIHIRAANNIRRLQVKFHHNFQTIDHIRSAIVLNSAVSLRVCGQ